MLSDVTESCCKWGEGGGVGLCLEVAVIKVNYVEKNFVEYGLSP
jgi:hypothetical protein